jgi:FAD/FMN-containing dehydrogenase
VHKATPRGAPPTAADGPSSDAAGGRRGRESHIPGFSGEVLVAGDAGYEAAWTVWNGAVDRHPAYIARCGGADGVAAAVRFARERDLPLAVRGGGHSLSGASVCDGGLVLDLSRMRGVQVDPRAGGPGRGRRAPARAGRRLRPLRPRHHRWGGV